MRLSCENQTKYLQRVKQRKSGRISCKLTLLFAVLTQLCHWYILSLIYGWSYPHPACPLLTPLPLEISVWGFQRRRVDTSCTRRLDRKQSAALRRSLNSPSVSLDPSPLSFFPAGSCFTAAHIADTLLRWWT